MLSNPPTFLAAEHSFRHDRARRQIADAAVGRRLRRVRPGRARRSKRHHA